MKKIITLAFGLLVSQITQAQGTIYLSNLGQTPTGSLAVGSDSWRATGFGTGNNTDGYLLDSVQLAMADAAGNASGFTVMIYSSVSDLTVHPGSSLGTLNGSANPSTAGTYTYTPASSLMLSPSTAYYIVLTAGTTVVNGAYEWSLTSVYSYNPNGGWVSQGGVYYSNDGSSWGFNPVIAQFAITATPVPEPSPSWLFLLGSGAFLYVRRTFNRCPL